MEVTRAASRINTVMLIETLVRPVRNRVSMHYFIATARREIYEGLLKFFKKFSTFLLTSKSHSELDKELIAVSVLTAMFAFKI